MNDFTKEELKKIKLGLYALYQQDGLVDTVNLISRLQSMIDNYCEHEWDYDQHHKRGKCLKCGVR